MAFALWNLFTHLFWKNQHACPLSHCVTQRDLLTYFKVCRCHLQKFSQSLGICCQCNLIPSSIPCFLNETLEPVLRGTQLLCLLASFFSLLLLLLEPLDLSGKPLFCLTSPELILFLSSTWNCVYKYSVTKVTRIIGTYYTLFFPKSTDSGIVI